MNAAALGDMANFSASVFALIGASTILACFVEPMTTMNEF